MDCYISIKGRYLMIRGFLTSSIFVMLVASSLVSGQELSLGPGVVPHSSLATLKPSDSAFPMNQVCTHRANNMYLAITNYGCFGSHLFLQFRDCETNLYAPSCEFPAGSQHEHIYVGALWIGTIVGMDTLVSTGYGPRRVPGGYVDLGWELLPLSIATGEIEKRTTRFSYPNYSSEAVSDLDMIALYTDTLDDPEYLPPDRNGRPHIPLSVRVLQKSFSWSAVFAEDFVMIDYDIKNIGIADLEQVYVGIFVLPYIGHAPSKPENSDAWYTGFVETYPSRIGQGYRDTIELAWAASNDGDPNASGLFDYTSVTSATGLRILRKPADDLKVSFNWFTGWEDPAYSWGPMLEGSTRRMYSGGQGHPLTDGDMYFLMANGERDYDQLFAARSYTDEGWLPPRQPFCTLLATRGVSAYVMSLGPFDIPAGESVPLTIAYIGGEDFHHDPQAHRNYVLDTYDPDQFYRQLDFSDLVDNALRAGWVYDNPGYDTDNDGYAGPYWEIADTLPNGEVVFDRYYYAGDGVPDFKPAVPPPPPVVRYNTQFETVRLRWNGLISESHIDPFTRVRDFEGYRVYMGRLNRLDDYAMVASQDFEDYWRLVWNSDRLRWDKNENPMTLDSLRKIYGDGFEPDDYPKTSDGSGLIVDSLTYCFEPADWNQSIDGWGDGSDLLSSTEFSKVYADEIAAGTVTSEIDIEDTLTSNNWIKAINPLTGDSIYYHKYYEYEFTTDNLLASVSWHFAVTAFDFGDAIYGIEPQETSPLANSIEVWAIHEASEVIGQQLKVELYPNPYYGDGRYADARFEDPMRTGFVDHERRIHFVSLPAQCKISIFTLDGDLVRELDHPGCFSDTDSKLTWNVRSVNNEIVTSGIYLFIVESEWGNQIGKLVIIL